MRTPPPQTTFPRMALSRRELLVSGAGALLLAACGGAEGGDQQGTTDTTASSQGSDGTLPAGFQLVQRFPSSPLFTPGQVRLPISLGDGQNLLTGGPRLIDGWIETSNGDRIAELVAERRSDGIVVPYWEVRAELPEPAIYTLRLLGDDGYGATFELFEPGQIASPLTGSPLPPFPTPTVDDHRGVEPYCTLTPDPCPFHALTLTEALAAGTPLAYIVGTPAHCQTGTCAPGLELLVEASTRFGERLTVVHADVYADDAATKVAPAVEALGIDYEPVIYLCDAKGVIVDRLDAIWDRGELNSRLDVLMA